MEPENEGAEELNIQCLSGVQVKPTHKFLTADGAGTVKIYHCVSQNNAPADYLICFG